MSSKRIIEDKISVIKQYLKILKDFRKFSQKQIEEDLLIKGAVERYLYLVCQASIDLSDGFIAYKNFRKPTTLSESFSILNEENIITLDLTEQLVNMTGFRNIVAHDYLKIDYARVCDILQNGLKDIEEFIKIIEGKIK